MKRWTSIPVLAIVMVGVLTGCHGGVHATFTVNTGTDALDVAPGDGVCEVTAGVGDCTLRAAIGEANALNAGADPSAPPSITIVLATDVRLSLPGRDENANSTGDLDIIGSLSLDGAGFTVSGAQLDRVLHVRAGTVTLRHVTITLGWAATASPIIFGTAGDGGGILTEEGTTLNVVQSRVVDNLSWGAGVCLTAAGADPPPLTCGVEDRAGGGGIANRGTLNLVLSTVAHNYASPPFPCQPGPPTTEACALGFGGGVLADGPLVVVDSTFSDNLSDHKSFTGMVTGSAISVEPGVTGTVRLSTFVDNPPDLNHPVLGGTVGGSVLVGTQCAAPSIDANHNLV